MFDKAVEVCNNPCLKNELDNVVLRMGAFHIGMTFIAVIGRRCASAGLRDVLVVLAAGSVDQVLNGRHYNRAIRCLKSMFEAPPMKQCHCINAMSHIHWKSGINCLVTEDVKLVVYLLAHIGPPKGGGGGSHAICYMAFLWICYML